MKGDRFTAIQQCTLDANGNGQVILTPPGINWQIETTSVSVTTSVKQPVFQMYRNSVSPSSFLQGSYSGALDSSDTGIYVFTGQTIIGVWTGGDVGSIAVLRLEGTQD